MRHAGGRIMLRAAQWVLVTGALCCAPGPVMAAGESDFVGLTPCRLVDTRGNGFGDPFGPPALATGVPRDFPLQGQCGIPATAAAVSLNVTATATQGAGFLLLHPQGGAQPLVSTLNYVAGETVANAAIVPLGPGGLTVVAGVSGTDLILDVNGYFTDSLVHGAGSDLFVGVAIAPPSGAANTTVGAQALRLNTSGFLNTAVGAFTLLNSTTGGNNTAIGANAMLGNTGGDRNTAIGASALPGNTIGSGNTAVGYGTFTFNSTGSNNIAVGAGAGSLVTGNDNIAIGHTGLLGDVATIRLGTPGLQTRAFSAGIYGASIDTTTDVGVLIDANGQLGTPGSSRQVKIDIEPVGERSRGVHALRPVSFHYRAHPDGPLQYGLIAEEVSEVYPELIVRDAEGAPLTVRYHVLPALLLNELQRQARELEAERAQRVQLTAALAELAARLARLEAGGPVKAGQ